jgi:hypothetical protein
MLLEKKNKKKMHALRHNGLHKLLLKTNALELGEFFALAMFSSPQI